MGRVTVSVPRGRHAPPLEVRLGVQRQRLNEAASEVFCRMGYADASAEAIAREAGMSKATFYEHFSNKEECMLSLFDEAVTEVARVMGVAASGQPSGTYHERVRAGIDALLQVVGEHPRTTQTLLVEIIGAGPKAIERRDAMLDALAAWFFRDNEKAAAREGVPAFASPDDALAVAGAVTELMSRQVRTGRPERMEDLAPIIERVFLGTLQ
jgi:AcrR family transcriptional regulator